MESVTSHQAEGEQQIRKDPKDKRHEGSMAIIWDIAKTYSLTGYVFSICFLLNRKKRMPHHDKK